MRDMALKICIVQQPFVNNIGVKTITSASNVENETIVLGIVKLVIYKISSSKFFISHDNYKCSSDLPSILNTFVTQYVK